MVNHSFRNSIYNKETLILVVEFPQHTPYTPQNQHTMLFLEKEERTGKKLFKAKSPGSSASAFMSPWD